MHEVIKKALGLQMNGFTQEALSIYQKALLKEPSNTALCEYYGAALLEVGQIKQAQKLLKKALASAVEKPQVLNNLATANRALGNFPQALINVQSALKFRPDYVDAWVNCGNIQCDLKNYSQAIHCYQKALKFHPNDKEVYLTLGNTYLRNHEIEHALNLFTEQKKRHADVRFLIGELICYRAKEDYVQALAFAEKLKQQFDNELFWFEWVQTLWLAKKTEDAKQQAQEAIEKFGHYPAMDEMLTLMNDAKVN